MRTFSAHRGPQPIRKTGYDTRDPILAFVPVSQLPNFTGDPQHVTLFYVKGDANVINQALMSGQIPIYSHTGSATPEIQTTRTGDGMLWLRLDSFYTTIQNVLFSAFSQNGYDVNIDTGGEGASIPHITMARGTGNQLKPLKDKLTSVTSVSMQGPYVFDGGGRQLARKGVERVASVMDVLLDIGFGTW